MRIRSDIEGLAAFNIEKLSTLVIFELPNSKRKVLDAPYLSVHLRSENDALGFWPKFETQSLRYLNEAGKREFKRAYIATRNATEAHRFSKLAMEYIGMKIVGKVDLL